MPVQRILLLVAIASLLTTGCTSSAGSDSAGRAKAANNSAGLSIDEDTMKFLVNMVDGRRMNYEGGKLAAKEGTSSELRAYGELMMRDQTQLLKELSQLASDAGVTVPEALSDKRQAQLDSLQAMSGKALDKAMIKSMATDHDSAVRAFEKASNFRSPAINSYANKTLPMIKSHLEGIEAIKNLN